MESMGGRLGRREKAKGDLWDGIKSKRERHTVLLHCGCRTDDNIYSTWRWHVGPPDNKGLWSVVWCLQFCPEWSGKGDDSDISKVCYLRCKKALDRLT